MSVVPTAVSAAGPGSLMILRSGQEKVQPADARIGGEIEQPVGDFKILNGIKQNVERILSRFLNF